MRAGGVLLALGIYVQDDTGTVCTMKRNARVMAVWSLLKYSAGKLSIIPMPPSRVLEAWNLCFSNHEYRYKQRQRADGYGWSRV
eukprot:scaffold2899_cov85-Skeletonema_dohrnii-CCMP3373.AAC.9